MPSSARVGNAPVSMGHGGVGGAVGVELPASSGGGGSGANGATTGNDDELRGDEAVLALRGPPVAGAAASLGHGLRCRGYSTADRALDLADSCQTPPIGDAVDSCTRGVRPEATGTLRGSQRHLIHLVKMRDSEAHDGGVASVEMPTT
eukprot:CAMPEP_0175875456 /NCGR_PEP_ID=MMETSP0107_2-20121207/39469_1 /TAXON_ID=195067 ORGANISM="Goniomonas pacifica, Strain CCMP1869" /NCGR_SAMPLE_ID=MMETSP0107_2 /ASSEMBLY_ACC=CAM_ASM_000203 /LENGTH=147 /DNA_ID=CAMNT_0017194485 /DNA_START=207 /DNA_END=652 /DNA_ORIENTATION=-